MKIWRDLPVGLRDTSGIRYTGLQNDGYKCGYYTVWWSIQDYFYSLHDITLVGVTRDAPPDEWPEFVRLIANSDSDMEWLRNIDLLTKMKAMFTSGDSQSTFRSMFDQIMEIDDDSFLHQNKEFETGYESPGPEFFGDENGYGLSDWEGDVV